MLFYILLTIIILYFSFLTVDKRTQPIQQYLTCIIFIIILTFIAGTRCIGYDFTTYYHHFNEVPDLFHYSRTDTSIELSYELLVSICKLFTNSFNAYLTLYAGLTLSLAALLCFRYSPYPLISFAMFYSYAFCLQVMGQIRQPFGILCSMLILIPLFLKKKYLIALLLILFNGYFLHKSLFFCIFMFIFRDKILTPKAVALLSGTALLIFLMSNYIFQLITIIIPNNFYLYGVIYDYLYTNGMQFSFSLGMIERLFIFLTVYYIAFKYNIYQSNKMLRLLINMYFMGVCLYFSFIRVAAEFASRGTFFYIYSFFLILPILIKETPTKVKYYLLTIALLWSLYLSTAVIRDGQDSYIPYKNIYF